jgi:hypothetical protein
MRTLRREEISHALMDRGKVVFGQVAKRDATLVGDDDDGDARFVQLADGRGCAWKQAEVVGLVHKRGLVIQHAISIEEYGRSPGGLRTARGEGARIVAFAWPGVPG